MTQNTLIKDFVDLSDKTLNILVYIDLWCTFQTNICCVTGTNTS